MRGGEAIGLKSAAYVPVPTGALGLGIVVFTRILEPFSDGDVAVLQAFAAQAANTVERVRRADDLRNALSNRLWRCRGRFGQGQVGVVNLLSTSANGGRRGKLRRQQPSRPAID